MEISCPKYPLIKTIGIQQTILLYAKESYEPILNSLKEADSDMAVSMIEFIYQQLMSIERMLEKSRDQLQQINHLTDQQCEIDFDDLDIICYPVGNDPEECRNCNLFYLPQEVMEGYNIWESNSYIV